MPDARTTNLPRYPTAYYGRDQQQRELIDLLLRDETRLVTLLGPGGIGKTRLAVEVARQLSERVEADSVFVDLAPVRDAQRLLEVLASTLQVADDSVMPIEQRVAEELSSRAPLVILDNLEQIPDAAAAVSRLLGLSPGVTFLATTRIPLRISGERQFPVPPLLPSRTDIGTGSAELRRDPAIAMFVDRAQAVRPDFKLTETNLQDVLALCARVDGLPLAIELAATRLRLFSPAALLAELNDRLALLSRGPVDSPLRQQTMHEAIAWSTDLLQADELRLLHAVSVFEGSFDFAAAAAVADVARAATADLLTALVEKSLVQAVPMADGEIRCRLLQTVRDVVRAAVDRDSGHDAARNRHAAYFIDLAADIDAGLMGEEQAGWVARAEIEYENLRAALEWLVKGDDGAAVVRLVASLWPFWYGTGRLSEGRQLLETAVSLSEPIDPGLRARAFNGLGAVCSGMGDYGAATTACERALELWRASGDPRSVGNGLSNLGTLAERRGDNDDALRLYNEALDIFTGLDDRYRVAAVLTNIANVTTTLRDFERARQLHQRSLGIRRALNDETGIAQSLHNLGIVLDDSGDHVGAERYFAQALPLFEKLGDPRMVATTHNSLGTNARQRGALVDAERNSMRALELSLEIGDSRSAATAMQNLGQLALVRHDNESAMQSFRETLERSRQNQDLTLAASTLELIAEVALNSNDAPFAARLLAFVGQHREREGGLRPASRATLESLRTRLGEGAWRRATDEGAKVSFDEIVDLALAFDPTTMAQPAESASVPSAPEVARSKLGLTARELDVLRLVADGRTNAEIGDALYISPFTAKTHVANLLGKLAVESRAAAATWAARNGVI